MVFCSFSLLLRFLTFFIFLNILQILHAMDVLVLKLVPNEITVLHSLEVQQCFREA